MEIKPYKRATDVLYRLDTIRYTNKAYARYPHFKVERSCVGYFHTLEDAEKRISKLVAKDKKLSSTSRQYCRAYFGFMVMEIPFDWELVNSDYSAQRTRTYLEDGSFLCETKVSNIGYEKMSGELEPFKGRAEEECPFKVGDLVEVYHGEDVTLEIVYSLPASPSDVEQMNTNVLARRRCWSIDYSDDSYVTLDGDEGYMPNHSYTSAIQLFPVRCKVSDKLRDKLIRGLEKVQKGE